MATGASEAETFWTDFLRSLAGTACMASSSSSRMRISASKPQPAGCWVPQLNAVGSVSCATCWLTRAKRRRRLVSAWTATAFAEADVDAARKQRRSVAEQLRPRGLGEVAQGSVDAVGGTSQRGSAAPLHEP